MAAKRKNTRKGFQNADAAFAYFKRASKKSRPSKGLTKHQTARSKVKDSEDLSKAAAKYKKFLGQVHDAGNRHLFTIAFSQSRIDSTKVSILEELVSKLNEQGSNDAVAQALFDTTLGDNQALYQPQPQSQKRMITYEGVPPEGIKEAFGPYLVNKIETAKINDNWRAVTMRLPEWPGDDGDDSESGMSLEILEECINELANALYKVEVERIADTYHIIHADGMVQIIRPLVHEVVGPVQIEHDLVGVLDDDIYEVFGSTVYEAIRACPARKKELAEGVGKTTCVKMTISKGKCRINLSMSHLGGVSVLNKLWTTVPKP
jgi:hypothetical protein